jgi:hypothetical protein
LTVPLPPPVPLPLDPLPWLLDPPPWEVPVPVCVLVPLPELPVCDPPPLLGVGRVVTVGVDRVGALVVGAGMLRTGVLDPLPAELTGGALLDDRVGVCPAVAELCFFGAAAFFTTLGLAGVRGGVLARAGLCLAAGFGAGAAAVVVGTGVEGAAVVGACCALVSAAAGWVLVVLPPNMVAMPVPPAIATIPAPTASHRRRRLIV